MISRARLIFVVFYITAAMLGVVHLRTESSRSFNRCRRVFVVQSSLKQQLWQKQIELESLVNPQSVWQKLNEQSE